MKLILLIAFVMVIAITIVFKTAIPPIRSNKPGKRYSSSERQRKTYEDSRRDN